MFSFGSATVTWSSKKQPTVALSSTEVEYRGAAVAACEVVWLQKLLNDLEIQNEPPVVIYYDNLSSIQLARNPVFQARTKHIEVHYHFIREKILAGEIDLVFVSSEDQTADIFTKALRAEKLHRLRDNLGVQALESNLSRGVENSSSTANVHVNWMAVELLTSKNVSCNFSDQNCQMVKSRGCAVWNWIPWRSGGKRS